MPKRIVLLVHGINSQGDWYPMARRVLEPHFDVRTFRYGEFEEDGFAKVVIGVPPAEVLRRWGSLTGTLRDKLREDVVMRLRGTIEELSAAGDRPHVVAHSFGSYLLGEALEHFPSLVVDRVVLVGSVMRLDYPWHTLIARPSGSGVALGRVSAVRNETSDTDPLPRRAEMYRMVLGGLGGSGSHGFHRAEFVHNATDSLGACPACRPNARPLLIHNVPLGPVAHSDHFLGTGHGERFWLPFFWGISPAEYLLYAQSCTFAFDALKDILDTAHDLNVWLALSDAETAAAVNELRRQRWSWLDNQSLTDRFTHIARLQNRDPRAMIRDGIYWIVRAHHDAKRARAQAVAANAGAPVGIGLGTPEAAATVIARLHPIEALRYAVVQLSRP